MLLNTLRSISGSLMKKEVLKGADFYERKMFQYAYDRTRMYYQRFDHVDWSTVRPPHDMDFVLLDRLLERRFTGHAALAEIKAHCAVYGDLVKLICNKDLDCGVNAKTITEVFGRGFIPTHSVALAQSVELGKVVMPVVAQLKYNGVRVTTLVQSSGELEFVTRNGLSFKYPELEEIIRARGVAAGTMLDGELCVGNSMGTNHTDVSGAVNSALKGTPIRGLPFTYQLFDHMSLEDFLMQSCRSQYRVRFQLASEMVGLIDSEAVQLAETHELHSRDEVQSLFDLVLSRGGEGLILKRWAHLYSFKRSKDWIKMKAELTADLRCLGWQEGTGKYQGMVGALVCEGLVGGINGKMVRVNVGSGLSDAQRALDPSEFLNHTVEVMYNEVIQDRANGGWSLFLPRFVKVRGDL